MLLLANASTSFIEGKIANGQVKAEPGFLKQLNAEMQAILDLPRP